MSNAATNPLRPVVHRLNSTAVSDLPQYVGYLASSILRCQSIFKDPDSQKGEGSIIVHKLKTRISALLQDRAPEGRFAGIVLAKAIIDAGGLTEHAFLATWVRLLVSGLNKADAVEVKKLALITVTRIFLLTTSSLSLVREVTSPVLPSFIPASLNLVRPIQIPKASAGHHIPNPLLETVLQCWLYLIPDFGSTFRPHVSSLKAIILSTLEKPSTPQCLQSLAANLYATLPRCAPKNGGVTEWENLCLQTLQSVHQNADVVFRSVIEDWTPSQSSTNSIGGKISSEIKTKTADLTGMEKWSGLKAGTDRIVALLRLVRSLVSTRQVQGTSLPLALLLDMTGRLTSIVSPSSASPLQNHPEVSRNEREELWLHLPDIHLGVADLLQALISAHGQALRAGGHTLMLQILDIFAANNLDHRLRSVTYKVMGDLLSRNLAHPAQPDLSVFTSLIRGCCRDLREICQGDSSPFSRDTNVQTSRNLTAENNITIAPDTSPRTGLWSSSQLADATRNLLPLVLAHSADILSSSVRSQVDQSIILANQQQAMLASVLHQQPSKGSSRITPSILPFLARAHHADLAIESLLRPRMPITRDSRSEREQLENLEDHEMLSFSEQQNASSTIDLQNDKNQTPQETLHSPLKREYDSYNSDSLSVVESLGSAVKKAREQSPATKHVDVGTTNHEADMMLGLRKGPVTPEKNLDTVLPETMQSRETDVNNTDITLPAKPMLAEVERPTVTTATWTNVPDDSSDDDDEIPEIDATVSDEDTEEEDEDEDS